MSDYPETIPTWESKTDHDDIVFAAHVNKLQDELDAALTELGTTPKGLYTDVAGRLDDLVDKTTEQSIAGAKTFSDDVTIEDGETLAFGASEDTTQRVTLDTGYHIEMYWAVEE